MKRHILTLAAICGFLTGAVAAPPSGYYDTLDGLCGDRLKDAVKKAVADHDVIDYGTDTWMAFAEMDIRRINGVDYWWDMYSPNLVRVSYPVKGAASGMNIEHSVANSWWGKTKNDAYKDLVHLNPSDADANNRKANYPLGEISGNPKWTNGETSYGNPVSGQGGGAPYVYEPCDEYKGDFARVFMYMFTVYDNISWTSKTAWMYTLSGGKALLQPWAYNMMIRWSDGDPVSDKETFRNEKIQEIQGNRNPFVDYPELADHIWGTKKNLPFRLEKDTGIEEIYPAADSPERIFDINGREVTGRDLQPGVYIRVKGPETSKILVR